MIDVWQNRIEAIKAVRQFCVDTYGVDCGLRGGKELVDVIRDKAIVEEKSEEIKNIFEGMELKSIYEILQSASCKLGYKIVLKEQE